MASGYAYRTGQALPAMGLVWSNADGTLIDFSSGWTFSVKIADATTPTTTIVTKTTGITGAATSPNITINWTSSDFNTLTASTSGVRYVVNVSATRNADSLRRDFRPNYQQPADFTLFTAPT